MIDIKNLSKSFVKNENIIHEFNLKLERNGITCLLGPSGCGKTTLLRLIAGLAKSDGGSIDGVQNISFGYVFQEDRLLPWLSVRENIEWILKKDSDVDIDFYLKMLEIENAKNLYPKALSGGMKQRVSIARAFAFDADIILMDEPFKSLDYELKMTLMNSIIKLNQYEKKTIIIVTHDVQVAAFLGDNIILLKGNPLRVKTKINSLLSDDERVVNNPMLSELEKKIYSQMKLD
ncbi:MAG: ATP-binding cassette domain-containing protein [Tissierellales bacterium]|jgi:NitT/TauT family transport system ATP-binding protein|nr:ATP-binding cassette domain-containing protein [Tissierellales bacterium]